MNDRSNRVYRFAILTPPDACLHLGPGDIPTKKASYEAYEFLDYDCERLIDNIRNKIYDFEMHYAMRPKSIAISPTQCVILIAYFTHAPITRRESVSRKGLELFGIPIRPFLDGVELPLHRVNQFCWKEKGLKPSTPIMEIVDFGFKHD